MSDRIEATEKTTDNEFLTVLEAGIRSVLSNRKTKPSEKVAAIVAGTKLMAVKHKINDADQDNYFK